MSAGREESLNRAASPLLAGRAANLQRRAPHVNSRVPSSGCFRGRYPKLLALKVLRETAAAGTHSGDAVYGRDTWMSIGGVLSQVALPLRRALGEVRSPPYPP